MKLPFLKKDTEPAHEYYLALLLSDEKAVAVIFETVQNKIRILNQRISHFTESIETLPLNQLIDAIDKAISTAEEILPPKIETHKTIFGVKENWIEQETKKIKKEYLTKLKKVCDSLDLSPLGFMVVSEALSNLIQQEEGAPLSAIFAEIGTHRIDLTLFRGGKIVERINGKISGSIPTTVDELLKHFTTPVLPARLIISDSDHAEELSQQFIAYQWSKSLPFLHMPQVTVLPNGFDAKSVVFGAAQQMGFETPEIIHDIQIKPVPQIVSEAPLHEDHPQEHEQRVNYHQPMPEEQKASALPANPFGFVMDEDIAQIKPEELQKHEELPQNQQVQDVQDVIHEKIADNVSEATENYEEEEKAPAGIKKMFPAIHLPRLRLPSLGTGGLLVKLGVPVVILIVIFGGLIYYYLYKVQAAVILSVSPKMVEQSADVTFSTSEGNDFSQNIIAAKEISTSVDGKASENATGSKNVGDKAKGTVTIYNSSDSSQDVSSGTQLKSSTGLIFTTDSEVSVPAASGDIFSGTKPGTTDVDVTANDIGPDYNLPSGTTFSLSDSLAAKNDSAFSGGSKKTVTVVSQSDITKVKTDLVNQLEQNATNNLTQQTSGNEVVLPVVLDQSLSNTGFSNNVGDQASKVTISGTVTFSGVAYTTDDLNQFAQALLKDKYSQNISFADNSVKETVNNARQKGGNEVTASVDIQAGLLPQIDTASVLQQVQGKSASSARETLSHLPQVSSVDIQFSPNLPLLPSLLPKMPKQITVQIKPE